MLAEPRCWTRHCKHFIGVSQPDGTEMSERNVCKAFPEKIPDNIAYGNNPHDTPQPEQGNDLVYEQGSFRWEEDDDE